MFVWRQAKQRKRALEKGLALGGRLIISPGQSPEQKRKGGGPTLVACVWVERVRAADNTRAGGVRQEKKYVGGGTI